MYLFQFDPGTWSIGPGPKLDMQDPRWIELETKLSRPNMKFVAMYVNSSIFPPCDDNASRQKRDAEQGGHSKGNETNYITCYTLTVTKTYSFYQRRTNQ